MDSPDVLMQLGIGGIFAVLLLREVFGFLDKKRNGHGDLAGYKSSDFWVNANRELMSQVLVSSVVPILQQQAKILDELRMASNRQSEVLLRMEIGQSSIRESLGEFRSILRKKGCTE